MTGFASAPVISQGRACPLYPVRTRGPAVLLIACHWGCGQSTFLGGASTGPWGRGRQGVETKRVRLGAPGRGCQQVS